MYQEEIRFHGHEEKNKLVFEHENFIFKYNLCTEKKTKMMSMFQEYFFQKYSIKQKQNREFD